MALSGAQITRQGAVGVPRQAYGDFSNKAVIGGVHPVGRLTRLGSSGTPRQRYGDFSGKQEAGGEHPVGELTRLGATGVPRQRYGDFSGKGLVTPVVSAGNLAGYPAGGKLSRVAHFGAPLSSVRSSFFASVESDLSTSRTFPQADVSALVSTPKRRKKASAAPVLYGSLDAEGLQRDELTTKVVEVLAPTADEASHSLFEAIKEIAKRTTGEDSNWHLQVGNKNAILEQPDYLELRLLLLLEG